MFKRIIWGVVAILSCLSLFMLALNTVHPAQAQAGTFPTLTPQPSPTANGGSAQWQIGDSSFTSNYPFGWSFSLKASSSVGKIKNATVVWKHSPTSLKRASGTLDAATGTWSFTYDTRKDTAFPAWVLIQYWFVLEDEQGNLFTTASVNTEYADNSKAWGRAESEDIIIFFEKPLPEKLGELTLEAMAKMREKYQTAWGSLLSYKPRAIIYADRQSYSEWDANSDPKSRNRTLGITVSAWGGTVQVYDARFPLEDVAEATVPHEVGHLYQSDKGATSTERWWTEGQASFFELVPSYDYIEYAKINAQRYGLASIREGFNVSPSQYSRAEYDTGYAFFVYLTETYGLETHFRILQAMQRGSSIIDAVSAATGQSIDAIDQGFRQYMGLTGAVPTEIPTEGFKLPKLPPTPTYVPTKKP